MLFDKSLVSSASYSSHTTGKKTTREYYISVPTCTDQTINPLPLFFGNKNNVKVLDLKQHHFSSQRSGGIIGSLIRDRWVQKILLEHKPYVEHCARCKGGQNEENACGLCLQGVSYMISKTYILNSGLYKIDKKEEE